MMRKIALILAAFNLIATALLYALGSEPSAFNVICSCVWILLDEWQLGRRHD